MEVTYGSSLLEARLAVILAHGRGANAESMLPLAEALAVPGVAFLLPQARDGAWYPYTFLAPIEQNEPALSQSLDVLRSSVMAAAQAGLGPDRVVLGGFSQGACLALEFAARQAGEIECPWAGVLGFSGGLIGPPGEPLSYAGRLEGARVLLGCSDQDPHIPRERVEETARVFEGQGAEVTLRLYPNMGHTINDEELRLARQIIEGCLEIAEE